MYGLVGREHGTLCQSQRSRKDAHERAKFFFRDARGEGGRRRRRRFCRHDGLWMLRGELNWSGEVGPDQGAAESTLGCDAERDAVSGHLSRRRPTRTAHARGGIDSLGTPLPTLDKGSVNAAGVLGGRVCTRCGGLCAGRGLEKPSWTIHQTSVCATIQLAVAEPAREGARV